MAKTQKTLTVFCMADDPLESSGFVLKCGKVRGTLALPLPMSLGFQQLEIVDPFHVVEIEV